MERWAQELRNRWTSQYLPNPLSLTHTLSHTHAHAHAHPVAHTHTRMLLPAGSVGAFLHENLHHFVDASAVEDMAGCLAYLSDADCIAGGMRYGGECCCGGSGAASLVGEDKEAGVLHGH